MPLLIKYDGLHRPTKAQKPGFTLAYGSSLGLRYTLKSRLLVVNPSENGEVNQATPGAANKASEPPQRAAARTDP
ncbi:MAG: hypothetical protein DMG11_21025 [Acidobacteria bacterium]|nr:MAG: hypothetical protein DMG11_21025 [Acidobacteriota bacterium]